MPPSDAAPRLADVNLNLVVALDALLDAGTVTAAARRLGVTQSATSHALRQLRELLGDPILVRGASGLVLTPRAESLRVPVRRALLDMQHALRDPPSFDPATTERRFRLGAGDYVAHTVLPALLQHSLDTPGLELDVGPFTVADVPRLATGELDLAISVSQPHAPGLRRMPVFTDDFVCLVRRGHPHVRRRLTLRQFIHLPHVLISTTGTGVSPVSNETVWPWYNKVAPVSWLITKDTLDGRRRLNFSEWGRGRPVELDEVEEVIREAKMPLPVYLPMHPEAKLSEAEREQLLAGLLQSLK